MLYKLESKKFAYGLLSDYPAFSKEVGNVRVLEVYTPPKTVSDDLGEYKVVIEGEVTDESLLEDIRNCLINHRVAWRANPFTMLGFTHQARENPVNKRKPLTNKEQQCLEHLQRAEELGATLSEYAAAYELDVKDLYQGKRQLVRKGVLDKSETVTSEDFISVRIAEPQKVGVCRLRHPSGWELECDDWPSPKWVSALFAGGADAP